MNDSSVDMELRLFLRDPKLEVPIRFEYVERVREALREADIEIPFPHLQLFVDEAQAFEGTALMAPPGATPRLGRRHRAEAWSGLGRPTASAKNSGGARARKPPPRQS